MATAKSVAMMRDLKDRLVKYVAATLPVATDSNDSSGNPVLTLSADATPATGEKVIVIRILPFPWPNAYDSLGLAGGRYTPHVIQICTEKNFEGTTDNVLDILGPAQLLPVLIEIGRRGCIVEWYRSANGTVPSTTVIDAGTPDGTWRDLYWNIQTAS